MDVFYSNNGTIKIRLGKIPLNEAYRTLAIFMEMLLWLETVHDSQYTGLSKDTLYIIFLILESLRIGVSLYARSVIVNYR